MRVLVTIFQCKNKKYCIFWVCVCSLRYPARNAHASWYTVTCDLSGCTIFFHVI